MPYCRKRSGNQKPDAKCDRKELQEVESGCTIQNNDCNSNGKGQFLPAAT